MTIIIIINNNTKVFPTYFLFYTSQEGQSATFLCQVYQHTWNHQASYHLEGRHQRPAPQPIDTRECSPADEAIDSQGHQQVEYANRQMDCKAHFSTKCEHGNLSE